MAQCSAAGTLGTVIHPTCSPTPGRICVRPARNLLPTRSSTSCPRASRSLQLFGNRAIHTQSRMQRLTTASAITGVSTDVTAQMAIEAAIVAKMRYGWVMLSVAFTALTLLWMMIEVSKARKAAGVEYPAMVADPAVHGEDKASKFNCTQRGHQNTLEALPLHLAMQMMIAQIYPLVAAIFGFVWTIGRIVYMLGYKEGGPKKRFPGAAISQLTTFGMIGTLIFVGGWLVRGP